MPRCRSCGTQAAWRSEFPCPRAGPFVRHQLPGVCARWPPLHWLRSHRASDCTTTPAAILTEIAVIQIATRTKWKNAA